MNTKIFLLGSLALALGFSSVAAADSLCVDPEQSRFTITTGTSGLFGAVGHSHEIAANGIKGCAEIDWSQLQRSSVNLIFPTAAIKVLDPKHPKDRAEVQATMEKDVLRV